jgi:hypothetical protein
MPELADFKDEKGRIGVVIEKALYGLVQSANLWHETLTGVLSKDGFKPNPLDNCVWNKTVNEVQTTIVIYVDDLLITSKSKASIKHVRDLIEHEFLEIKTKEGNEVTYLGMNLKRSEGSIEISMKGYIESMLGLEGSKHSGVCKTRRLRPFRQARASSPQQDRSKVS